MGNTHEAMVDEGIAEAVSSKAFNAVRFDRAATTLDLRALRAKFLRDLKRIEWEWDRRCNTLSAIEAGAYRTAISEIELVISSREFKDERYKSPYQPGRWVHVIGDHDGVKGQIVRLLRDGGVAVKWPGIPRPLEYMAPHVTLTLVKP